MRLEQWSKKLSQTSQHYLERSKKMADTFKGIITADGKKRQLPYGSILDKPVSDETLSIQGGFADAKVVGNNFKKINAETDSLKEDIDASFKKINSKNLFNYKKINNGYYLNQDGVSTENSAMSFIEDYFSVDEDTNYVISRYNKENKTYISGANAIISYYNNDKEFLSYKQLIDESEGKFTTPLNCKRIRISLLTEWIANELLQLEKGTIPTNYVEPIVKMILSEEAIPNNVENKTVINHLIVKKDGTGNFTKIQDAINSIKKQF